MKGYDAMERIITKVTPTEHQTGIDKIYTIVHTATDIDKGVFLSPCASASYLSLATAQVEMERQIVDERDRLDARYDFD